MGEGKDRDIGNLRPFLKALRDIHPDAKVIMFGSRARRDHIKTSDFDLLVVSKDFEGIPFRERLLEAYDLIGPKVEADIICLSDREFKERRGELGIVGKAAREGIPL